MAGQGWSRERYREFWRQHLIHVGYNVLEPEILHRKSAAEIREVMSLEGEEHLREALAAGRGVMILTNHAGPSACVPLLSRFGYDITVAGDAMLVPHLERKLQHVFDTIGAHRVLLGDQVPQRATAVFQRNSVFASYSDLSTAEKHTEWLPFGPAELRVPYGPAVIALRNRVPVLYTESIRLPGPRYKLVIHPPLQMPPPGRVIPNACAVMTQANAHLFQAICARPEQWWALDYVKVRERPVSAAPSA
jgi:KDO2-lipid IV(A) lauroyltransferase